MGRLGKVLLWTGFILPIFLLAGFPMHAAHAKDGPPGPDGLPLADPKHPWKFLAGTPRVDTLPYAPRDIIPVARRQFEHDHWEIYSIDPGRGVIVTRWKPMNHILLRLFMGKVRARCTVKLQSLGTTRTRMVFQGDLASHRDLEGNPMLGSAKRAYVKAASHYQSEVRTYLNTHPRLSSREP